MIPTVAVACKWPTDVFAYSERSWTKLQAKLTVYGVSFVGKAKPLTVSTSGSALGPRSPSEMCPVIRTDNL